MNTSNNPSVFHPAVKTGLLLGLICIVSFLTVFYTHQMTNTYWQWALYAVIFFFVLVTLRMLRARKFEGYISFGTAFSYCFQTILYAGAFDVIFQWAFFKFFSPEGMSMLIKDTYNNLISRGYPQAQIDLSMKLIRMMYSNPLIIAGMGLLSFAMVGAGLSLILAAICKKERTEFAPEE